MAKKKETVEIDSDVLRASRALACEPDEIEHVESDEVGGLRVWYCGTYKHLTAARLEG